MKKMHLPSRLLSMLLVLALLCGFAAPVGAAGSSSTGLSLTQVDRQRGLPPVCRSRRWRNRRKRTMPIPIWSVCRL